jgi:uncharacterized membrane protein YedE/YeeE
MTRPKLLWFLLFFLVKALMYLGHVWVQFPKEFKNENQAQNFQNCLRFAPLIVNPLVAKQNKNF